MILPQRKRGPRSTRGWEKAQWESDASSRLLYAHAGVSWTNAVCARSWNCVRHFGPNWKLSTRPNSGSFPVSPHHFSLKYIQYSCEKMVCATRKSLAVGHISRFQIDPFQKKRMRLLNSCCKILYEHRCTMSISVLFFISSKTDSCILSFTRKHF